MQLITELIAAAMGTVAFCLLFGVPRKYYVDCGLIGLAGWLVYWLAKPMGMTVAVFVATLVIVLLSRIMAVRRQCPATVFIITGIFPLVPGAQIYWAAYYLVTGQFGDAKISGLSALKVIFAIVLGIVFMFEVPNKCFLWFRAKKKENRNGQ